MSIRPDNTDIRRRRSVRLRGYDYSQAGAYYVTVVTHRRRTLFGDVVDGEMRLNDAGRLIVDGWEWLASRHQYVELDAYVVMPNHLHGVIVIAGEGGSRTAPTGEDVSQRAGPAEKRKPLGRLVAAFKTVTTRRVNLARGTPGRMLWQRNYYEHVIRSDEEWNRVREYIANNPMRWELDAENPCSEEGGS